jgi:hypothetical protein
MSIKVIRTVGQLREDGEKDFVLHLSNGETVTAERKGNKFRVGMIIDTLKNIKLSVEDGLRWEEFESVELNTSMAYNNPWDCVDPAALLAVIVHEHEELRTEHVLAALDNYGFINPDGSIDVESAERAIKAREQKC